MLQPAGRLIPVLIVGEVENGPRELDEDLFSGGRGTGVVRQVVFDELSSSQYQLRGRERSRVDQEEW